MYRYFFRFVVTTLTILTANLITNALSDYMVTYKNHAKPIAFTFIAMSVIVIVFYPLFTKMEELLKVISVKVVKSGNSVAGKYFGLTMTFIGGILILTYFYAKMWYHIDLFSALFSGSIGRYF